MSLKRKHECCEDDDDDHEYKKIKFNELLFTNDYIQLILSFLDQYFIFRTCSLISKQFREQAFNTPVALHIKKDEQLKTIRNLTIPLNISELDVGKEELHNVLDWIMHHPPKNLKKMSTGQYEFSTKNNWDEDVQKLCSVPCLSTLTSLRLGRHMTTNEGCSLIANCEHFQNLTELTVEESRCDERGMELIVGSKYMNRLTALRFSRNMLCTSTDGILSNPLFLRLKKLDISYNSIEKLNFPQVMPLLEDLKLSSNNLKSSDFAVLEQTRNLTRLNLCANWLNDEGCKIISENQHLSKLTDLDLSLVKITNTGLKYIVSSPYFNQLKCLSLAYYSFDNEGCKILAESENMRNLTSLQLSVAKVFGNLTLDGLHYIFSSNNLCNLQFLRLNGFFLEEQSNNKFGDMLMKSTFKKNLKCLKLLECHLDRLGLQNVAQLDGLRKLKIGHYCRMDHVCECIASSLHMSNLTSLSLSCKIQDSGCLHLANSIYLTRLTKLNLSANQIGIDGCKCVANSPNFPNLTTLDLTRNVMVRHEALQMIQHSPHFKHLKLKI